MKRFLLLLMSVWATGCVTAQQETLPPLVDGKAAQNIEELWAGIDVQKEPLDVEVLKEWEEDGVVMLVLRYRVGIFKGQKSMMAAVYGYPKGGKNLPGLVQIHGGGQYAHSNAVFTNAKRGYASISISWAGRLSAPDYLVNPNVVKLFWNNETEHPQYRKTTDWAALDAYHAPSREGKDAFTQMPVYDWSADAVKSPRNVSWFLCTLGARRALTFLEQQPQVDGSKLGVYGHSMGGKLTVLTAGVDKRVKAAAPSCGGITDKRNKDPHFRNTVGDEPYLNKITCPTVFLSPANDFHGAINDLPASIAAIKTDEWRLTCTPHFNHQDIPEAEVATQLFFDEHLKGTFTWPETPRTQINLTAAEKVPVFFVTPDASREILSVEVYYNQDGDDTNRATAMKHKIHRYWHYAKPKKLDNGRYAVHLHLEKTDAPLWVYANVQYALDEPVTGAGYYYGNYTADKFNVSSLIDMIPAEKLQAAGIKATKKPSLIIEDFKSDWRKDWFNYRSNEWTLRTNKLNNGLWKAPQGASLCLKLKAAQGNTFVVGLDSHATEVTVAGGNTLEEFKLALADFKNAKEETLTSWAGIKELRLMAQDTLKHHHPAPAATRKVGSVWKGEAPSFQELHWIVE